MSRQLTLTLGGKTTINDLALVVCGGALHNYLSSHGELPDTPLVAMVPLAVRQGDKSGEAGNQVSAMFVPLGTHLSDPFERLEAVRNGVANAKTLTDAVGSRTLTEYTQFIPSVITSPAVRFSNRLGLADRLRPAFNCVVTNVPGPQVPLYMTGAKMVASYGFLPLGDGAGLGHVIGSYCGELTLGITACGKMMPDPDFYLQCLQASFDELQSAVMSLPGQCAASRG